MHYCFICKATEEVIENAHLVKFGESSGFTRSQPPGWAVIGANEAYVLGKARWGSLLLELCPKCKEAGSLGTRGLHTCAVCLKSEEPIERTRMIKIEGKFKSYYARSQPPGWAVLALQTPPGHSPESSLAGLQIEVCPGCKEGRTP